MDRQDCISPRAVSGALRRRRQLLFRLAELLAELIRDFRDESGNIGLSAWDVTDDICRLQMVCAEELALDGLCPAAPGCRRALLDHFLQEAAGNPFLEPIRPQLEELLFQSCDDLDVIEVAP